MNLKSDDPSITKIIQKVLNKSTKSTNKNEEIDKRYVE